MKSTDAKKPFQWITLALREKFIVESTNASQTVLCAVMFSNRPPATTETTTSALCAAEDSAIPVEAEAAGGEAEAEGEEARPIAAGQDKSDGSHSKIHFVNNFSVTQ